MDDAQVFAQVMTVIVCSIAALVLIAGVGRWMFRRSPKRETVLLTKDDDRLRRLEEAVDAIAVEVERISEGQRFTTRLLSERIPEIQGRVPEPQKPTRAS